MTAELTRMRILIVADDDADVGELEQVLTQAGYTNVLSARNAIAVRHLCATEKPELVLLDMQLRQASADQVLDEIEQLRDQPESLPVLILADAAGACEARDRAIAMNARDFVTRPLDPDELLLRVRNALHTRQLAQPPGGSRRACSAMPFASAPASSTARIARA